MTVYVEIDRERIQEMREREAFFKPAAEKVNKIARELLARGIGFGDRKAYISDVAAELGTTVSRLAPLLVSWNNLGWVHLVRADLVMAMPADKVRESEIVIGRADVRGSSFHFVDTFDQAAHDRELEEWRRGVKKNPGSPSSRAIDKFVEFHDFEPRETGTIPGLKIPSSVKMAGDAAHVMYRSDKWHKGRSDDYIHEHDRGVKVGRTGNCKGALRAVPTEIQRVTTLVRIGRCLGVAYTDNDGNVVEMRPDGSVQLYCSPNGRALFVVDGVRVRNGRAAFDRPRLEMILWGGRLGVEDRGIVH